MKKKVFLNILILISLPSFCFGQQSDDFEVIMNRIYLDYISYPNQPILDEEVSQLLAKQQLDGSWSVVNYSDRSQTQWSPDIHLKRIGTLTKAYTLSTSKYYKDEAVFRNINLGIQYWLGLDPEPSSTNWWYRSISVPQEIGRILISLRFGDKKLNPSLEKEFMKWMLKSVSLETSPGKDGSNLTDICQHMIMRACLTNDSDLLSFAVSKIANSIFITSGEGVQTDFSFRAHGPQLYIYGYGREFISGIRNIAVYTKGTSYAISPEKIAILSDFVRKGFIKSSRGAYLDYNVLGRGISRVNAAVTDIKLIEQVRNFDLDFHQEEYDQLLMGMKNSAFLEKTSPSENINFWRSDYMVHKRPMYMFSVNSVSTRTVKTEMGNGENIKGHFLTDGSNYIAVDGDEYFNIFPTWDWNKIPGTTAPAIEDFKLRPLWGANPGKTSFVGGVSDGQYGISVFDFDDYDSKAKKSWFFFDEEIVALGASIQSQSSLPIQTTLNQSHLRGEVIVAKNKQISELKSGQHEWKDGVDWIWHSKIGYYFPQSTPLHISNQLQKGSWSSINQSLSTQEEKSEVFKIWINHGVQPHDNEYAYIVLPGINQAVDMEKHPWHNINILRNTNKIQAVKHHSLESTHIIFYEKGFLETEEFTINVSDPCVLMLKKSGKEGFQLTIADPTQAITHDIILDIKVKGTQNQTFSIQLPKGEEAGKSVSTFIQLPL
jgi:chondroitin AC lyase